MEEDGRSNSERKWRNEFSLLSMHPVLNSFIIGSVSGTCSTLLFQPLDLLKTRLQTKTSKEPVGLVPFIRHILYSEKLLGLWKGLTPSLTRCVPGVGLYFASIHALKLAFEIQGEPIGVQAVLLGISARTFSGVLMIPLTVMKTRFESQVYDYGSIREAFGRIYGKEGIRGLTCGLLPTLLRDAPFSGIYLMLYTWMKKSMGADSVEGPTVGPYFRFSCGIAAGIGASLLTQPADVIKTKIQLYPDKFTSIRQASVYVYRKYGSQGFLKGLLPRMVRRTLIAAMSWTVYEHLVQTSPYKSQKSRNMSDS